MSALFILVAIVAGCAAAWHWAPSPTVKREAARLGYATGFWGFLAWAFADSLDLTLGELLLKPWGVMLALTWAGMIGGFYLWMDCGDEPIEPIDDPF